MRARNVKPAIYKNDKLSYLGSDAFVLFTGLWCMADREGRLEERAGIIEAELFPYKFQKPDIEKELTGLASEPDPFIIRYKIGNRNYIQIVNFLKHQKPHYKEPPSSIPAPNAHRGSGYRSRAMSNGEKLRAMDILGRKCVHCGTINDLTVDHIKPRCRGGWNNIENLQILCKSCNSAKGAKTNHRPIIGQSSTDDKSTKSLHDSLNPDVLIPDVLIPDVLNPDVPITPSAPDGRVKHLVDYFYKKASNPISFPGGQAGKFFKKALASMSVGLIQAYIDNWFSSTDPFVVKEAFRFGLFVTKFDALKGGPIYGRTTTTPSVRHITDDPKRTEAYRG